MNKKKMKNKPKYKPVFLFTMDCIKQAWHDCHAEKTTYMIYDWEESGLARELARRLNRNKRNNST